MADLVSPIVDIISRLWTCWARHTRYGCKLQENTILLRNAMAELKEARVDVRIRVDEAEADPQKKRTDQVSGWLQRVETIEGGVEVILQKADEQQLGRGRCFGGCCPPNKCWSNYKLSKSVFMKKAFVDELKVNGKFEELTYRLPPPLVQDMNLESTVGMESMLDKIWRLIDDSTDDKVRIVGLYGLGGVGKTTLLEQINNKFHNKIGEHGFDHVVIFVVVSKPINYQAIQNKIGQRLGLLLNGDESSRANTIFNKLKNMKFVILLDDIWERVDLQRIGIPIIHHTQGNSKLIIFTTRSERVCGEMKAKKFKVECLPWDKAWGLFEEMVGEDALNSFSDVRELAKVVAEECGGLPLALITIGRAMSTKKSVQEWRDAITTLRRYASEFKDVRDKVLPRLKLSYDNLSNETEKSCFRYCALFPEDYSIKIAKLVELWIAEGFLDGFDKLDEARDRGHTIIGSLKSACMLESSNEENHVKMHDVIRDLALWIVNDCSTRTDESGINSFNNKFLVAVKDPPCKKWVNAERIIWCGKGARRNEEDEKTPTSSLNLQTLIVKNGKMPQSFFQHMPLLRVLDLSNNLVLMDGEFLPISICKLHELQYLNLSWSCIKELPVELRKLVKLKFFVCNYTSSLRRIPAGVIANLSELQVLDLKHGFKDWELEEDGPSFSELDGLKQLQEVRITISTFVALEKFVCNPKLQMVCTGLYFDSLLSSSSSQSRRRVLDLSNFKSIRDIELRGFSEVEKLVILYGDGRGGLLSTLETLNLYSLKLNSIQWMASPAAVPASYFHSLHSIEIVDCNALKDLTWLVYVENLMKLYVQDCKGLETVIDYLGDEMLNKGEGGVFRRLKNLYLSDLPKLKSICRHTLAFLSIEIISIDKCPKLKKLPLDSGSNVNNTLQQIQGSADWWSKLQWEDETIKSKFLHYYKKFNR